MKRLVLSGYYGFDNAGDEAVLAGLVKSLRLSSTASDILVEALSADPAATIRDHRITASHRMRLGPVMRAITRCDALASGGGSLLQDATSRHGIFYYLAIVRLAQMLGKRTMFIAQGVGPLRLERSRRLTASVANRLDVITVRDSASADLLRAIGVNRPPIEVTADPALLLSPADGPDGARDEPIGRRGIGVALRPWQDQTDAVIRALAGAWTEALSRQTATLMAMQPEKDDPVGQQFAAAASLDSPAFSTGLWAHTETVRRVEMVIGMRLHALILAAAAGAPAVAISYDPKVAAFMRDIGQEDAVIDVFDEDISRISKKLKIVWEQRNDRSQAIQDRLPDLKNRAMRNAQAALSLLL